MDRLKSLIIDEHLDSQRNGLLNFSNATFVGDFDISWHHRVMCRTLNRLARGEIRRLIITMPPRHSKSEFVSRRLPAFMLGRNPDMGIICASYSDSLAARMNRDVQRIMELDAYRHIFPGVELGGSGAKTASYFEINGRRGFYRSAGIGGSITGFGANLAVVDDYCRNQADADSPTIRERVWEWFGSVLMSRLEKEAAVLITATRWNEDDLIGRLLALAAKDPKADQWEVLTLPALKEGNPTELDPRKPGESLWPNKYSPAVLEKLRATIGVRAFTALYQQRPAPEEGNIIKKDWWRYYEYMPERFDKVIMSWDLAFDKSDSSSYVVGVVLGRVGADIYLIDMFRQQTTFTGSLAAFRQMVAKYPDAEAKYVEKKANGAALIDTLRTEISGIIAVEPHGSKIARANAVSPRIEAGNVWLPAHEPWTKDVVLEWCTFPAGAHEDIVDAMSQGIMRLPAARDDFLPLSIDGGTFFPQ